MTDLGIFALRLLVVVFLYVFLALTLVFLWHDMRSPRGVASPAALGWVRVAEPGRSGLRRGTRLPLNDLVTFGRMPDNTIVVNDESVSGHHASIRRMDGRWWLEDSGSTNGTRVNGRPVNGAAVLVKGDLVELGLVQLRVESD